MLECRYVVSPRDPEQDWRVARLAHAGLRRTVAAARDEGVAKEIIFRDFKPQRTDPQRRTMWKWHSEVASELTIRTGMRWKREDVHELIFLPRFMPTVERVLPSGEIVSRPMRTSEKPPEGDDRSTKQIISEAMTDYLRWIYEQDIEVTVPETGW